jgi:DNA primase catalytic core
MAKQVLGDYDLPEEGDIIDQVAHQHNRLSIMKKEVAELKSRTDFKGLLAWLGFEVKKNGRGWKILCPFHNDTVPSCSVDFKKNRFHCFGCSTKGDTIEFVKLYKHTDFKGALEILKEYNGLSGRKNQPAPAKVEKEKPPQADITYSDIADYYHKKLFENKKAIAYLKKRGFTNPELYARFKIGYVDGSLPGKLSENQKKALKQMNILNDRGTERFYKRIVFPLYDENNKIINFYGRSITDD